MLTKGVDLAGADFVGVQRVEEEGEGGVYHGSMSGEWGGGDLEGSGVGVGGEVEGAGRGGWAEKKPTWVGWL